MMEINDLYKIILPIIYKWMIAYVRSGAHFIVKLQKFDSYILRVLCLIISKLGGPFFYQSLILLVHWNMGSNIGRYMIIMWGIGLYINNYIKDLLLLPRPVQVNDSIIVMDTSPLVDFGLPSSQVYCATYVTAILIYSPHFIHVFMYDRIVIISLIWLFLSCISRMYLGLHCPAGVICAIIIGVSIVFISETFHFQLILEHTLSSLDYMTYILFIPFMGFILIILYPSPPKASLRSSYPDTSSTLGLSFGVITCHCIMKYFIPLYKSPYAPVLPLFNDLMVSQLSSLLIRNTLALTFLLIMRVILTKVMLNLLPPLSCFENNIGIDAALIIDKADIDRYSLLHSSDPWGFNEYGDTIAFVRSRSRNNIETSNKRLSSKAAITKIRIGIPTRSNKNISGYYNEGVQILIPALFVSHFITGCIACVIPYVIYHF